MSASKHSLLIALLLVSISSCPVGAQRASKNFAPPKLYELDDARFTQQERKIIALALDEVSKNKGQAEKALVRVDLVKDKYEVFVQFYQLDDKGQRIFIVDNHALVSVNRAGKILNIFHE